MSKNLNSASPELKMKIVEAWVVFKWIKNFMQSYNIEFNPAILSGQEYDFKRHGKMLEKLSEVVSNITPPYSDETVTLNSLSNPFFFNSVTCISIIIFIFFYYSCFY